MWNDLDLLVNEYLIFRDCLETSRHFTLETEKKSDSLQNDKEELVKKFEAALENTDTITLLETWDDIVVHQLELRSESVIAAAKISEFNIHILCATLPFRSSFLKVNKSPSIAAKAAAHSMSIFKKFVETRGKPLLKNPDFAVYRNLHKIAFPPTHPSYTFLFRDNWEHVTKSSITQFLNDFVYPQPPPLCTIYSDSERVSHEENLKSAFKQREIKLMQFSRSIYDISQELLNALEDGSGVNKEFLQRFREKFDEFSQVLESQNVSRPRRKSKREGKNRTEINPMELNFRLLADDLSSMFGEVESELSKYLGMKDLHLLKVDAEILDQSSTQASMLMEALINALKYSSNSAEESICLSDNSMNTVAKCFTERNLLGFGYDIFGVIADTSVLSFPVADIDRGDFINSAFKIISLMLPNIPTEALMQNTDTAESAFGILLTSINSLIYTTLRLILTVGGALSQGQLFVRKVSSQEVSDDSCAHNLLSGVVNMMILLPMDLVGEYINQVTLMMCVIIVFAQDRRSKILLIKSGLIEWISGYLGNLIQSLPENISIDLPSRMFLILLIFRVINMIVENPDIQRMMASSQKLQLSVVSIIRSLCQWLQLPEKFSEDCTSYEGISFILSIRAIILFLREASIVDLFEISEIQQFYAHFKVNGSIIMHNALFKILMGLFEIICTAPPTTKNIVDINNLDFAIAQVEDKISDLIRDAVRESKMCNHIADQCSLKPNESGVKLLSRYTMS